MPRILDGQGATEATTTNMGHAVGTGLLTPAEETTVAEQLGNLQLLGDFGLRTLSTDNPGYNPIGYHTGSIWAHDSAIAASSLAGAGYADVAGRIMRGLLAASAFCDFRLPELFGGESTPAGPIPYPASCRPQAWAAAAGPGVLAASLGIRPDLPRRRISISPLAPGPFGALRVDGIRLGSFGTMSVAVDADGRVVDLTVPAGIEVITSGT